MRSPITAAAMLLSFAACSMSYQSSSTGTATGGTVTDAPVEEVTGPSTAATLDIPPGHLPDAGECRIWIPGTPPGRQAKARSCQGILDAAPAGAMVLEGLPDGKQHVRVMYIGERAGEVTRSLIFEKQTGKYVREGNR